MKRSAITTNTVNALEKGIDVISRAYDAGESVGKISPENLIHALWADLGMAEKAEQLPVPQRQWRCEQDRMVALMARLGQDARETMSPAELAYVDRQRGPARASPDETIVSPEDLDWTDETESPAERRARNWARRAR
jgi:hypothetical protein